MLILVSLQLWLTGVDMFRCSAVFRFQQIEVTGNSLYKYIHPCDHEELANQLGGQIPLEDMEIFDGLFCSDSVFMMSNHLKGGSKKAIQENPHKSFFLRMKSTLTSRGKSVNLRASTYRVRRNLNEFPFEAIYTLISNSRHHHHQHDFTVDKFSSLECFKV